VKIKEIKRIGENKMSQRKSGYICRRCGNIGDIGHAFTFRKDKHVTGTKKNPVGIYTCKKCGGETRSLDKNK
jgi:RNase P subunit RPR2